MSKCNYCPRNCNVDRQVSTGYCKVGLSAVVARIGLHNFEEPCISGTRGSGTVFFSGCNLKCVYCQNYKISGEIVGKQMNAEQLADRYLELQDLKAHNINLVTPSHNIQIVYESLIIAKQRGLYIPIVYNTSGYDSVQSLTYLKDVVDIYLTDIKYRDNKYGKLYSNVDNYFDVASQAVKRMKSLQPIDIYDDEGMMLKGLIVRHMVLPLLTNDSLAVLDFVAEQLGKDTAVSIMSQYFPPRQLPYANLNRRLTQREYDKVVNHAVQLGLNNSLIQELSSAVEEYVPDFDEFR